MPNKAVDLKIAELSNYLDEGSSVVLACSSHVTSINASTYSSAVISSKVVISKCRLQLSFSSAAAAAVCCPVSSASTQSCLQLQVGTGSGCCWALGRVARKDTAAQLQCCLPRVGLCSRGRRAQDLCTQPHRTATAMSLAPAVVFAALAIIVQRIGRYGGECCAQDRPHAGEAGKSER